MKKTLKRIGAMLIAMIMVIAMCVPAMAETTTNINDNSPGYPTEADGATVTVSGFTKGQVESVTAYQIVDAVYNEDGQLGFSEYVAVKDLLREAATHKVDKSKRVPIFGDKPVKNAAGQTEYTYKDGDSTVTVYSEDGTTFVDENGDTVTIPAGTTPEAVTEFIAIYPTSSEISLLAEDSTIVGEGKGVAMTESSDGKSYSADLTVGEWLVIAKPATGSDTVYNPMLVSVYYVLDENGVEQIAIDPITAEDHWGGKLDVEDAYIKSSRPTVTKEIVKNSRENSKAQDSADHGDDHAIGDTVDFKATSMIPSYSDEYIQAVLAVNKSKTANSSYATEETLITYRLTDTMEPGLTYLVETGLKVTVGKDEQAEEYTVIGTGMMPKIVTDADGNDVFTYYHVTDDDENVIGYQIAFAQDYILSHDAAPVTVEYAAQLNENATVNYDANENTINLTYTIGNDPETLTENGEPVPVYEIDPETGEPKIDPETGNPIPKLKEDEYGHPIPKTDENGNPVYQVGEDGKPKPKLDNEGHEIPVYETDENGTPILDENGNKIPVYKTDENGDPIPVYETNDAGELILDDDGKPIPVIKTDEDGNPIPKTDEDGNPIPLKDKDGNPIPAYEKDANGNPIPVTEIDPETGDEVPVLDEDGNPVYQTEYEKAQDGTSPLPVLDEKGRPVKDEDGNPVYQPVYQKDDNGNPIQATDAEGNPIYKTDEDGNPVPVYKRDPQGNPIPVTEIDPETGNEVPVLDDDGKPVYQVEYETDDEGNPIPMTDEEGKTIYDEDGNPVPQPKYEPEYLIQYEYEPEYEYEQEIEYEPVYLIEYETEDDLREIEDTTYHYTFEIDGDVLGETEKTDDDENPDTPDQTEHRTHELVKLDENGSTEKNQKEVDKGDGKTETRHVSNPLAGAIFELTRTDDFAGDPAEVYYAITDEDGLFGAATDGTKYEGKEIKGFTGLDAGTYTMKEVKAPDGYSLNRATFTITISAEYYSADSADHTYKKGMLRSYTISVEDEKGNKNETTHVATYMHDLELNDNDTPDDETDDEYVTVLKTIVSDKVNGIVAQASTLIRNTKLTNLPSTGGIGSYLFTIIGVAVMAIVAGSFFRSRAKKA